jgi:WD40 repeat protein
VVATDDYAVTHEARDSLKWITDIKYSPNGELIAMGSFDNKIYVYNVSEGYNLSAVINKHQNWIRSIDFSVESDWLQSNCAGYELMFFEADSGLYIPAASRLRDTLWSTQNCTMGWPVQGIWPTEKNGTDCTACECNLFRTNDGTIVVSGDNYGRIQLYRYPCTSSFAISKKYHASSNAITRLRFAGGDSRLLSVVAADKAIMQWIHTRDRSETVAWNLVDRKYPVEEDEEDVLQFFGLEGDEEVAPDVKALATLMGGRPWIAAVVPPTDAMPSNPAKPNLKLELSHIFGHQTEITRNSTRYNIDGNIIFPTSRYVCVFSKKKNQQSYFHGHSHEISCVSASKDGKLACSAETCNRPNIIIWDASSCQEIITLPSLHRRGVASMEFSPDRRYLVSVGK